MAFREWDWICIVVVSTSALYLRGGGDHSFEYWHGGWLWWLSFHFCALHSSQYPIAITFNFSSSHNMRDQVSHPFHYNLQIVLILGTLCLPLFCLHSVCSCFCVNFSLASLTLELLISVSCCFPFNEIVWNLQLYVLLITFLSNSSLNPPANSKWYYVHTFLCSPCQCYPDKWIKLAIISIN
jgi:hypothetical protein